MPLIADDRYFALVKTLTELDQTTQCPFANPRARRTWIETQVQEALCAADIYPSSSDESAHFAM
ncbi:hypothetical protein [Bradyrhizobium diazoefficiens]|uniref:Uncharacterized protein n=1 Tax=Bradyrhizobium diazoefficiens TaxID=1355477 RepID=A0A810BDF3_9BRAD|nr:hypothetical protein XF8B_40400 [Bradyrhizobium diazoefficiens]